MSKVWGLLITATFLIITGLGVIFFPASVGATGTVYSMTNSANFNARFDGPLANGFLAYTQRNLSTIDLNRDGTPELLVAPEVSNYGGNNSGTIWVIDGKSVTNGTFNLATTSNFSFRIDGEAAGARLGFSGLTKSVCDLNGNGKPDLVMGAYAETVRSKGSVYVIYDDIIDRFFADGQTSYSMSNNVNYSFRLDGVATGDSFGRAIYCNDYDGNGKDDLYISATQTDYTGSGSGSLYIIGDTVFSAFPNGSIQTLTNNTGFTLRIDGAAANDVFGASLLIHDFNNDSHADLVIGASETSDVSAARLGMYYLIDSSKYFGYTTEGNVLSVVSGNNIYNARFTFSDRYYMGRLDAVAANFTNENGSDLILISDLGGYPTEYRGYVHIIPSSVVLNNYADSEKDISLDDPDNYFLKIYGEPSTPYHAGYQEIGRGAGVRVIDVNSDNLDDLVISASWSHYAANQSGSLIIIDHTAIAGLEGNGHSLTPSDLLRRRYDGGYRHFFGDDLVVTDLNGDDSNDLLIGAQGTGYVASYGGSVYVVYNFPHTVSLDPLPENTTQDSFTLTGNVVAPNSVTSIAGVEWSLDNNPRGTWTGCSASDGSFNSTLESFSCEVSGYSEGTHQIYVRAYDTNTSYTASSHYASVGKRKDVTAPKLEYIVVDPVTGKGYEKTFKATDTADNFAILKDIPLKLTPAQASTVLGATTDTNTNQVGEDKEGVLGESEQETNQQEAEPSPTEAPPSPTSRPRPTPTPTPNQFCIWKWCW